MCIDTFWNRSQHKGATFANKTHFERNGARVDVSLFQNLTEGERFVTPISKYLYSHHKARHGACLTRLASMTTTPDFDENPYLPL